MVFVDVKHHVYLLTYLGKREIIYLSPHCHHQNDSCIKMGSDESYFHVSLSVGVKVTRQCVQWSTTFEEEGEPKRIRTEVPSAYQPCVLTPRPNWLTKLKGFSLGLKKQQGIAARQPQFYQTFSYIYIYYMYNRPKCLLQHK